MATNKKFFILTGEPGVGKTTLTKKISTEIAGKGIKTTGFYTEEIRKGRIREGFDVVTLEGTRGRLARNHNLLNNPVKFKLGKYGVLVEEFENIALPSLVKPENAQPHLLVIDEVGWMEMLSPHFKTAIKKILSPTSEFIVLATMPFSHRAQSQLFEDIRNLSQAKVWMVTRANRNSIDNEILNEMKTVFNFT